MLILKTIICGRYLEENCHSDKGPSRCPSASSSDRDYQQSAVFDWPVSGWETDGVMGPGTVLMAGLSRKGKCDQMKTDRVCWWKVQTALSVCVEQGEQCLDGGIVWEMQTAVLVHNKHTRTHTPWAAKMKFSRLLFLQQIQLLEALVQRAVTFLMGRLERSDGGRQWISGQDSVGQVEQTSTKTIRVIWTGERAMGLW